MVGADRVAVDENPVVAPTETSGANEEPGLNERSSSPHESGQAERATEDSVNDDAFLNEASAELIARAGFASAGSVVFGRTALHWAADHGHEGLCLELIQKSASDEGISLDATDNAGRTALHCAAAMGLDAVCSALLARLNDPMLTTSSDDSNRSALRCAAVAGHASTCLLLLEAAAFSDEDASSALRSAAASGHESVCSALLDAAQGGRVSDLSAADVEGMTALHHSAANGLEAVSLALVRASEGCFASGLDASDAMGRTALHISASKGLEDVCIALVEAEHHFSMFDATDNKGRTALHLAAEAGLRGVCARLIESTRFSNFDAMDHKGRTALHIAALKGDAKMCTLMLSNPSFTAFRAIDDEGFSAAHRAATCRRIGCCVAFLDAAEKAAETQDGCAALGHIERLWLTAVVKEEGAFNALIPRAVEGGGPRAIIAHIERTVAAEDEELRKKLHRGISSMCEKVASLEGQDPGPERDPLATRSTEPLHEPAALRWFPAAPPTALANHLRNYDGVELERWWKLYRRGRPPASAAETTADASEATTPRGSAGEDLRLEIAEAWQSDASLGPALELSGIARSSEACKTGTPKAVRDIPSRTSRSEDVSCAENLAQESVGGDNARKTREAHLLARVAFLESENASLHARVVSLESRPGDLSVSTIAPVLSGSEGEEEEEEEDTTEGHKSENALDQALDGLDVSESDDEGWEAI